MTSDTSSAPPAVEQEGEDSSLPKTAGPQVQNEAIGPRPDPCPMCGMKIIRFSNEPAGYRHPSYIDIEKLHTTSCPLAGFEFDQRAVPFWNRRSVLPVERGEPQLAWTPSRGLAVAIVAVMADTDPRLWWTTPAIRAAVEEFRAAPGYAEAMKQVREPPPTIEEIRRALSPAPGRNKED